MTPFLLSLICEPVSKAPLDLVNPRFDADGNIESGELVSPSGKSYPIVSGIPRFDGFAPKETVQSFGDEWNFFDFADHKENWLAHTVANTFGSVDAFEAKLIVDAGGGSGAQSRWFLEHGAKHVVMLELSHSVDGVAQRNLRGLKNVDVVQCSIDAPPLKDRCIDGIVYCHNVIQHTPSVERTARELFALTAPGGEFVFNCYQLNDRGVLRWMRWHLIYRPVRAILSRMPFMVILSYARVMAILRLIPGIGGILEKLLLVGQGDVPRIAGQSSLEHLRRRFRSAALNTFDAYGSHSYQHHKRDDEIQALINELQPDVSKVLNADKYFRRPPPIGCALRLFR